MAAPRAQHQEASPGKPRRPAPIETSSPKAASANLGRGAASSLNTSGEVVPSSSSLPKPWLRKLLFLLPVVFIVVYTFVNFRQYFTLSYLAKNHEKLRLTVEGNFLPAAAAYVVTMALVIGLTVPGATFLSFAGGVLFPQPFAALFAYLGYVSGAALSFLVVTFLISDLPHLQKLKTQPTYHKFEKNVRKNAFLYLIVARFTFVFPFWFVNSVSALVGLKFRTFLLATNVSVIPGSIVYTSAGRSLTNLFMTISSAEDVEKIDMKALVWQTLADPNIQACLLGIVCCLAIALAVAKMFGSGEEDVAGGGQDADLDNTAGAGVETRGVGQEAEGKKKA